MGKFRKRQAVRIVGADRGHHEELVGMVGRIYWISCSKTVNAVEIPGVHNPKSSHGVFYFTDDCLEPVDTKQTNVNKEEFGMKDYSSVVSVTSVGGTWCDAVCACYEADIKEGDCCVMLGSGNIYEVGYVTLVIPPEAVEAKDLTGEVICKVDDTAYKARVEQRKQEKELKAKMAERAKKLQDIVLYETLAKSDPEMQQLLDQYKTLNGF